MTRARLAGLLVGFVAATGIARRAHACSIAVNHPAVEAPAPGADGVPTNAVLWFGRAGLDFGSFDVADRIFLHDSEDNEIELDRRVVGEAGVRVLTPAEELLPRTTYEVWGCRDMSCAASATAFTTGDGSDVDPPPVPVERGRVLDVDRAVGLCGGTFRDVELDIEFEGVLIADIGLPEFDEEDRRGPAEIITTEIDDVVTISDLLVGSDTQAIRIGVYDQAGNFSGWVELEPLVFGGCGCTSAPGAGAPIVVVVLLLLAVARRRPVNGYGGRPAPGHARRRAAISVRPPVELEKKETGSTVTAIALETEVDASGIDDAAVREVARNTEKGCPASKAIAAVKRSRCEPTGSHGSSPSESQNRKHPDTPRREPCAPLTLR